MKKLETMKHKLIIATKGERQVLANRWALFMDRDGVVVKEKHFLSDPNDVEIHQDAKKLIKSVRKNRNAVIIVTNQSGIERGFFEWKDYQMVTDKMLELLGEDAQPTAIYANGYGPDKTQEQWRKPNPGMLLEAEKDLNIRLDKSAIIGDRETDLKAGQNCGLDKIFHVLTGHGRRERAKVEEWKASISEVSSRERIRLINCLQDINITQTGLE